MVLSTTVLPAEVHSATALLAAMDHLAVAARIAEVLSALAARIAADHSAVAQPVAAVEEDPSAVEATDLVEAKAAAIAGVVVFSAEAVKTRTSAFIIRWTSRIEHLA